MPKYARNMPKYAYEKYAIYVHNKPKICIDMLLYADKCVIQHTILFSHLAGKDLQCDYLGKCDYIGTGAEQK